MPTANDCPTKLRKKLIDLGPINWLLGISITHDIENHTISLSQEIYVNQILMRFGLDKAKAVMTPMEPGINLTPDSPSILPKLCTTNKKTMYHEMIGSLMYLSTMMPTQSQHYPNTSTHPTQLTWKPLNGFSATLLEPNTSASYSVATVCLLEVTPMVYLVSPMLTGPHIFTDIQSLDSPSMSELELYLGVQRNNLLSPY